MLPLAVVSQRPLGTDGTQPLGTPMAGTQHQRGEREAGQQTRLAAGMQHPAEALGPHQPHGGTVGMMQHLPRSVMDDCASNGDIAF